MLLNHKCACAGIEWLSDALTAWGCRLCDGFFSRAF